MENSATSASSDTASDTTTLKRRRGTIKGQITTFTTLLDHSQATATYDIDLLLVRLEALNGHWKHFEITQSTLEGRDENETTKRQEIEDAYYSAFARARKIIREKSQVRVSAMTAPSPPPTPPISSAPIPIKLPQISLPTFDGTVEDWPSFYDLFSSLIDRNDDLTPVQKLQYLRSALKGKAAASIAFLSTTDQNYTDALDVLKRKFDCTRKIVRRHWAAMRDIPRLTRDTPEALGELVDTINQNLRALKNLGEPVTHWNTPVIDLVLTKISLNTTVQWELTLNDNAVPSYTHLLDFIEKRAECSTSTSLTYLPTTVQPRGNTTITRPFVRQRPQNNAFVVAHEPQCVLCKEAHTIWTCQRFRALSVDKRIAAISKTTLCFNCLGKGHLIQDCFSGSCRICQMRHHTLLHQPNPSEQGTNNTCSNNALPHNSDNPRDTQEHTVLVACPETSQLLVTAQVYAMNKDKAITRGRSLIDTGASTNFITEAFAATLQLNRKKCCISVGGLNSQSTVSQSTVTTTIRSLHSNFERELTFFVVPRICNLVPDRTIDRSELRIPPNLKLADPEFHRPSNVDLLIGAGTALSILCVGQINLSPRLGQDLYLQKTRLGWVIGGSAPIVHRRDSRATCMTANVHFDIAKFWEIEEGPSKQHLTESETQCENHFQEHVTRNPEGRYCVALPFNGKESQLGESRAIALKRLQSLERKFERDNDLRRQYEAVLEEYISLQHMTEVSPDAPITGGYYLPHHSVMKETSLTTKLRVVFDASASTTTGVSLNDALHIGPSMQSDLLHLLLRFRIHTFVLTGDIEKMYRQFLMRPEDRKYQRILWRIRAGEVQTYELNTVTFGVASAPYLATRCLSQLAEDEATVYPRAAAIVRRDFYVDDVLTGASSREEALSLRQELIDMLKCGGLHIRQWASNDAHLLRDLPADSINKQLQLGDTSTLKTLGIIWNSANDSISYTVQPRSLSERITKRLILSEIAKIYDPLGLLGPVIIVAKIIIQKLWDARVDWDESLPAAIHTEWVRFYDQLPLLNNISFPRRVTMTSMQEVHLHCFSDASEKAYGACVYLRTTDKDGNIHTQLLTAKSRVAPIKQVTIPRLELCGAVLSTALSVTVQQALHIEIDRVYYWTDSTIVLHWIRTAPQTLKTFVANRVADIQRKTDNESWFHVRTTDNPADLLSRGQTPVEFLKPSIWQHGPLWLAEDESHWPTCESPPQSDINEERRITCLATTTTIDLNDSILTRFSTLGRLLRVLSYCMRWRTTNHNTGHLKVSELANTHLIVIRLLQQSEFSQELGCLTKDKPLHSKSKLLRLNPFIDKEGMLRVGGRLRNSSLPFSQKHPIILPKNSHLTRLIIENEHSTHLHAGVQATLYALRKRYWIIDGRSQVWKIVNQCVRCCRTKPPTVDYIMGDLPEARITEARPFSRVGVDYCGPFFLKEKRHRNKTKIKAYVAVFVCLAVKAIHLEVVSDLTSEGFIAALRRFIGRRGCCTHIYSDNGSNFVGANNELREIYEMLNSDNHQAKIQGFLTHKSIQWHFIPPLSPHFGGLWEAGVKSFKYHLKRVMGMQSLVFEDFNTLTIEIESILNSRPLTPISSDPNDFLVLTPGHFLIGDSLTSLHERDYRDTPSNRLSMWQHIQKLRQDFWSRWHREYLNELTTRSKWTQGQHVIHEGTIVLLKEKNLPPLQWPLGRVIRTRPGADGTIRVVTVKTAHSEFDRNVKTLAPLPIQLQEITDETTP